VDFLPRLALGLPPFRYIENHCSILPPVLNQSQGWLR
jgi:hypothetical protein